MWFLCYLCYAGLIYHWVLFAKTERGWSTQMVSVPMFIASVIGMMGYVVCGVLMDTVGRRKTGVLFFFGSGMSLLWAFTARGTMMQPSLIAAIFFVFGLLPICSTVNAELFPTNLRANAAAWCNFLIGRPAQVLAPFLVAHIMGVVGGIGNAVCFLAIAPFAAVFLVMKFLPETKGIKMDQIVLPLKEEIA
jgi:MFS family permease